MSEADRAQFRAHLIESGYDDATADMMVSEQEKSMGGGMRPGEAVTYQPGRTAVQTLTPLLGAGVGGSVGRAVGGLARGVPLLRMLLARPVSAGVGEGLGSAAGMMATGVPPKEALKAGGSVGLFGGITEGALNTSARVLGQISGMREPAVEGALSRGPVGAGRVTRFGSAIRGAPAEGAEQGLASKLLTRAEAERAGTYRPTIATLPPLIRNSLNRAREIVNMAPMSAPPEPLASASARAMRAVRAVPGEVETAPIREKMQSLMRKPIRPMGRGAGGRFEGAKLATPQEELANKALRDAMNRLPPKFRSLGKLEEYLQRSRQPIGTAFGKDVPQLTKQDAKAIQATVRELRDRLLGGPESQGAKAFAQASSRERATKMVEKMLREPGAPPGTLRETAAGKIAKAGSPRGVETLRRFGELDPALARRVEELALQRQWTAPHIAMHGMRLAARPLAKAAAVFARPVGQYVAMQRTYSLLRAMEDEQRARQAMANP